MTIRQFACSLQPPLRARNGHTLNVLLVCRVSDPTKQDQHSPEHQEAWLRSWLENNTDLPLEVTVLAGSGSGECLERREYLQLLEFVESDQCDLVLTEDLGRIVRRIHAHLVCEHCVDHETRLISLNDHVDTTQDGWQDRSIFSAWHHERSNRDTSNRIKRTHRAKFVQGGCFSVPIYGYVKKPGAKSDDDVEKLPEAEAVYKEWFDRLDRGATYSEIADWLNESGVPVGLYCRLKKWDCAMVGRVSHNSILKGVRFRNKQKSKRNNETGRYRSEKADPSELVLRYVAHLAFFEKTYYDRVVAKADARNAKYRRNGKGGPDPLANRPRKRTRFPGQIIYCGICGRLFVFGGHGQKDHLECTGSREHRCWNGITVDGPLAAQRISQAVFDQIEALDDFDPMFMAIVNEEARRLDGTREDHLRCANRELHQVRQEIDNLMKFILGGDGSDRVRAELQRLEDREKQLLRQKDEIERTPSHAIVVPSAEEVKRIAREAFPDLALDSFEFAKRMRRVTGKIFVYPFRLCDGGDYVLRAKLRIQIAQLLPDPRLQDALGRPLERTLTLDLFDPPQRVAYREQILALRQEMTERAAAKRLGLTITAAQRAAALDRLMKEQHLTDPYVRVTEPPSDHGVLRRHLHARYRFEPLSDHTPDW